MILDQILIRYPSIRTILFLQILTLYLFPFFQGNIILHSKMVVEELGGWQDSGPHHGPWFGHHLWGGEAAEKETFAGLPLLKSEESQLLGLQIFLLWTSGPSECYRFVKENQKTFSTLLSIVCKKNRLTTRLLSFSNAYKSKTQFCKPLNELLWQENFWTEKDLF